MSNEKKKAHFRRALKKLGHEVSFMENKRLSIEKFSTSYEIPMEAILGAIEQKTLHVHYDYKKEILWLDLFEACFFSYQFQLNKNTAN